MTIDERLDALTHSVELLASMQRDNETRFDERFARLTEAQAKADERSAHFIETIDRGMLQVAKVLQNDEARIDGLEGQ